MVLGGRLDWEIGERAGREPCREGAHFIGTDFISYLGRVYTRIK